MIIDLFTYSNATPGGAADIQTLIREARSAGLDGICITDKGVSSHARQLVEAGKDAGFFIGVGLEIATSVGTVVVFPHSIDDSFVNEDWRSLGDNPALTEVLDYFHARGDIVIARNAYANGTGLKDRVFSAKDSEGHGFDGVDTVSPDRRRIDNELCIESQQVLHAPACSGSGCLADVSTIGACATLFADAVADQAALVDALKRHSHWACTLKDIGDACPMGAPRAVPDEEFKGRPADDRGPRRDRRPRRDERDEHKKREDRDNRSGGDRRRPRRDGGDRRRPKRS